MFNGRNEIENALIALSEQLNIMDAGKYEIVVCGGAALNILGYIKRSTQDIDVIAFVNKDSKGDTILTKAETLNPLFIKAAEKVRNDFNLPKNWINTTPARVIKIRLPDGLMDRVETNSYGDNLTIEIESAAKWIVTNDTSKRNILKNRLVQMGYNDVAEKL